MGSTVFTYAPDYQSPVNFKPNVRVAKFGDGYEQRVRFGINSNPQTWTLKFDNRSDSEAGQIEAFLESCGGWDSFYWQPPGYANELKFVCRQWSKSPVRGTGTATNGSLQAIWTINATFEQVFEP
jgi:phage-related protein